MPCSYLYRDNLDRVAGTEADTNQGVLGLIFLQVPPDGVAGGVVVMGHSVLVCFVRCHPSAVAGIKAEYRPESPSLFYTEFK